MKAKRPIALLMGFLMLITMTLSWLAPDSSVLAAEGTEVNTADDLDMIRSNPSGNYVLTADIQLEGEFTPISNFSGTLDGQGHTISGLKIVADDEQKIGFFCGKYRCHPQSGSSGRIDPGDCAQHRMLGGRDCGGQQRHH